jgi:hypothetical protein
MRLKPWYSPNDTEESNAKARRGFEALLTVEVRKPVGERYEAFSRKVREIAKELYGTDPYDPYEVRNSTYCATKDM